MGGLVEMGGGLGYFDPGAGGGGDDVQVPGPFEVGDGKVSDVGFVVAVDVGGEGVGAAEVVGEPLEDFGEVQAVVF